MPEITRSSAASEEVREDVIPDISVCESCPGTTVFLEAGNTDGWIASDTTVDIFQ